MFCKKCNSKVSERYNYCTHCQNKIEDRNYVPENIKVDEVKENKNKVKKNKKFIVLLSVVALLLISSTTLFFNRKIRSDNYSDFIEYNLSHYLKLSITVQSQGLKCIEISEQSKIDEYIKSLIKHIDEYKYADNIKFKNDLNISPSESEKIMGLNKEYKYQLETIKAQIIKYENVISNLKKQYNNNIRYNDLSDSQKEEINNINDNIVKCLYEIDESIDSIEIDEKKYSEYKSIYYNFIRSTFAYTACTLNENQDYSENDSEYANKYYSSIINLLELDYDMDKVYSVKNGDLLDNILYLISNLDYDENDIVHKEYNIYLDEEKCSTTVEKITEDGVYIVLNYQGWSQDATKEDKEEIVNFINEKIKSDIE